jgi:F-type H+-transporting ATPase subunit c
MEMEVLKYIGAGLMAFGMLGGAIGVGLIFNGATQAIARNPSAEGKILKAAIVGAGLAEALGLFAFAGIFVILFI